MCHEAVGDRVKRLLSRHITLKIPCHLALKTTPAAERQGEIITRRIGQYPTRKGADVAGWLI
ncbi:MAG: hypothetical protein GY938_15035 [Ketobacter sp.]|nr:hypothetical protein [Ketobacter sp.]